MYLDNVVLSFSRAQVSSFYEHSRIHLHSPFQLKVDHSGMLET